MVGGTGLGASLARLVRSALRTLKHDAGHVLKPGAPFES